MEARDDAVPCGSAPSTPAPVTPYPCAARSSASLSTSPTNGCSGACARRQAVDCGIGLGADLWSDREAKRQVQLTKTSVTPDIQKPGRGA